MIVKVTLKDSYENRMNTELVKQNDVELTDDNYELRIHDKFLRKSAKSTGKNLKKVKTSYDGALQFIPKKQEFSRITIKANENFTGNASKVIKQQIASKTSAKVIKINKANNRSIFVKCNSQQDSIIKVINSENSNISTAKTI